MADIKEALGSAGRLIIDVRKTEDIMERGAAIVGHINIPWTEYEMFETRFKRMNHLIPSKDTPVIVYADDKDPAIPGLFKAGLEECGYTNVHAVTDALSLMAIDASLQISHQSNYLPKYIDSNELHTLRSMNAVLIDARDPDEIDREKDAFDGHINIPWSTFSNYASRLNQFGGELLGNEGRGKDTPIIVICMRGRRAMFLKDSLEKNCGFTNVYNCENPGRVHGFVPELGQTSIANKLSEHLTVDEIKALGKDTCYVDAREPEEIERSKNAVEGHVTIPWSSFHLVSSRLAQFDNVICSKDKPVLVYDVNGRRALALKDALSRQCGFTNVFSCCSAADIQSAFPGISVNGTVNEISPFASVQELRQLFELGAIIVDVREPEEIADTEAFAGHINIPWSSIDEHLPRLTQFENVLGEKTRPLIVYCANGRRAGLFKEALEKRCGFSNVFNGEMPARVCVSAIST